MPANVLPVRAMAKAYQPVVIIGAPRSGTNMLRDVLTALPGVGTWPCDEINYIWRHGNVRHPSDEFRVDMATAEVRRYIRGHFDRLASRRGLATVVEKTCANSLRVPFVQAVLPEARYLFIHRDGLDAVGSAMHRWTAGLDLSYVASKARFVPLSDLPYYGSRYLWNRVYRLLSRQGRLAFWGPKLDGMDALLARHTLEEVCALQWQRCVDAAARAFADMPEDRYLTVAYEDFVRDPAAGLERMADFLGLHRDAAAIGRAVQGISGRSIGKGRNALSGESRARLQRLVGDTLSRYGYV